MNIDLCSIMSIHTYGNHDSNQKHSRERENGRERERERNESEIHQMNVEKRKLQVNFCLASERKT